MVRFHFCGGNDAPDWLLAEIALLSQLSSVRVKLLAIQVINELVGGTVDYEKIPKLVGKFNFTDSDVRASLAALTFILKSAAQFDVSHEILLTELQQLGLPVETCGSLSRSFRDKGALIKEHIAKDSLRLPGITKITSQSGSCCSLLITTSDSRTIPIKVSREQASVLLTELKLIRNRMDLVSKQIAS
ncbi:hypothetical protein RCL1_002344 [Eukaryota sp. TZLM3-RCL]